MENSPGQELWNGFIGITAPAIVNHNDPQFDSTVALYLGGTYSNSYKVNFVFQGHKHLFSINN